ncbi:GAF domain-containing protein [Gloeothece verrucosa]|uniref:Putative phytochrome sensor protein n=1 Tax=Gloeothece verrucosa (strain PCC 7822) TaxID=497965 RepID=E0ULF7_GLOV7|nr:GAF domain-containing protein [Gloeothece verrucosa]ADN17787.1 putative phytochrome sensor protein [Gloeothece verrucosa PCC 7822]
MPLLTREILEAGRLYRSTGAISTKLLRQEVYRAWERSHLLGANPRAMQAEKLSSLDLDRLLNKESPLIQAVRPYAQILAQAAGKEPHAVLLSDCHAVLLDLWGDKDMVQSKSFPQPGSLLSEEVAGANGIGTPLAEGTYSQIVTAEHFIDGFYPFTCLGMPVRNLKQEIVGVLNISLQSPEHSQKFKELLLCASAGVEAELILGNLEAALSQVKAARPDDYEVLEKLRQDLVQTHHAARLRMDFSSRLIATNRIDYAQQLLQQAEQSIAIFRHRSYFWYSLASSERDSIKSIFLMDTILTLVKLLSTEATIRQVEVITPSFNEEIKITVFEKKFLRKLLRYFLAAFEKAGAKGILMLEIRKKFATKFVQINFIVMPGNNNFSSNPIVSSLTVPINKSNQ